MYQSLTWKIIWFKEVSFFTGRGAPENWGDQALFLRSKGGIERFFQIKKRKYFVKHFKFRTHSNGILVNFTEKVLF